MTLALQKFQAGSDLLFLQIAREIAIEHFPIEEILARHRIGPEAWEVMQVHPRFNLLLEQEIIAWQSATNTHERTKLKAAALMEMWMEEAGSKLYAAGETLPSKIELAKLISRIAGMGITNANYNGEAPEKFSVTINIGNKNLSFEKNVTSKVTASGVTEPKTIEGAVNV